MTWVTSLSELPAPEPIGAGILGTCMVKCQVDKGPSSQLHGHADVAVTAIESGPLHREFHLCKRLGVCHDCSQSRGPLQHRRTRRACVDGTCMDESSNFLLHGRLHTHLAYVDPYTRAESIVYDPGMC